MEDHPLETDADQERVLRNLDADLLGALRRVMHVRPEVVIFGMSLPCFWETQQTSRLLRGRMESAACVPVATADMACLLGLQALPSVRRIGLLTPFRPLANRRVAEFFEGAGFSVTALRSTGAQSNLTIAHTPSERLILELRELSSTGCDAILQVGTNVASIDITEEATRWLGLPCLNVNALLYWHALRLAGLHDQVRGCTGLD